MTSTPGSAENNPHLVAALDYVRCGWRVFPCHSATDGRCSCGHAECEHPAKHPRTPHGVKDATTETKRGVPHIGIPHRVKPHYC